MEDLTALRKSLVRDGKLSDNDVECLRQKLLHDDGGITMEKGNLLFELKDTVSKKNLSARFSDLFVDAIHGSFI